MNKSKIIYLLFYDLVLYWRTCNSTYDKFLNYFHKHLTTYPTKLLFLFVPTAKIQDFVVDMSIYFPSKS